MLEYGRDLEQLMDELSGDKLEYEPPKTVNEPEPEFETQPDKPEYMEAETIDGEEAEDEEPNLKDVKGLPELIVGIIDIFAASVAEAWTKTEDKSKYRLDEDEKEQLVKAWELYLKNSEEVKINPSTMLLLTTGIIYAPRIILAINERKEQRMKQQQAAQEQQQ